MKTFRQILFVISFMLFSTLITGQNNIYVLATGGTIAGAQGDADKPGYKAGSFSVDDLISAVPKLKDIANLKGEQVANIGSQDMNDQVWLKLGKRINELLTQNDIDGIVITHGTDTYEETAYYLNLVVDSDKPVVMVASMRPATAISADGPMNLFMGVVVATHKEAQGKGVLCVMNDEIHYAAEITKTMTVNLATMKSPNRGLAGKVDAQIVRWFSPTIKRHTVNSEFRIAKNLMELPQVEIIYAHANMKANMIDAAVKSGAKGIVIAGVGDGNMTTLAVDALAIHAKNGIVVVRSSHVGMGAVKRNIEVNDDKMGFVAAMELNPVKSRVLLQQALLNKADIKEIQRMFMEY
jgi:L-asparaginase